MLSLMINEGYNGSKNCRKKKHNRVSRPFFFLSENVAMVTAVYPKVWDQSV